MKISLESDDRTVQKYEALGKIVEENKEGLAELEKTSHEKEIAEYESAGKEAAFFSHPPFFISAKKLKELEQVEK